MDIAPDPLDDISAYEEIPDADLSIVGNSLTGTTDCCGICDCELRRPSSAVSQTLECDTSRTSDSLDADWGWFLDSWS